MAKLPQSVIDKQISKDLKKYTYIDIGEFEDLTHIQDDERAKLFRNYYYKYDYGLTRFTNDIAMKDGTSAKGLLIGGQIDLWGSRAYRNKRLGQLRLALDTVMQCLYTHCPIDTGFGITHGIRYELTNSGAKIVIGRGIAEYLVHLSYPTINNYRGEATQHRHWIDIATEEARPIVKQWGYKLMKDHLWYGSMQLYLVKE